MDSLAECTDVELVALCGRGEEAPAWDEFVARFNSRIVSYVVRERRARGMAAQPNEAEVVSELTQEVYVRLLANDRRAMREFRGESEFAVLAYLARVARAVVSDHLRRQVSHKRSARLVSLDAEPDYDSAPLVEGLMADERTSPDRLMAERLAPERIRSILLERGGANAARDALVFQLHALDGFSAREIAALPTLSMSLTAVEAVLRRTRDRLKVIVDGHLDLPG